MLVWSDPSTAWSDPSTVQHSSTAVQQFDHAYLYAIHKENHKKARTFCQSFFLMDTKQKTIQSLVKSDPMSMNRAFFGISIEHALSPIP